MSPFQPHEHFLEHNIRKKKILLRGRTFRIIPIRSLTPPHINRRVIVTVNTFPSQSSPFWLSVSSKHTRSRKWKNNISFGKGSVRKLITCRRSRALCWDEWFNRYFPVEIFPSFFRVAGLRLRPRRPRPRSLLEPRWMEQWFSIHC